MTIDAALYSSKSVEWFTPRWLVEALAEGIGAAFTLDPCTPDAAIAKAPKFYTPAEDGLSQSWFREVVFCNPPYGRGIAAWVEKCARSAWENDALVVGLLPARTDTAWWQKWIEPHRAPNGAGCSVDFYPGRIHFGHYGYTDAKGETHAPAPDGDPKLPAAFPSAIVTWRAL